MLSSSSCIYTCFENFHPDALQVRLGLPLEHKYGLEKLFYDYGQTTYTTPYLEKSTLSHE